MADSETSGTQTGNTRCRHAWQPYADEKRIWQVCMKCDEEKHVTTYAEETARAMSWVLSR
jgi:hypothetical protein